MKNNAISLDEFWGVVTLLCNDAKTCVMGLEATSEDNEALRDFWRRMYARAVFAVIEGSTYRMMFHAYAASERPGVVFSVEELIRLEKYYDFEEGREAVATFSRAGMLEDMQFAFNAFARVHFSDYVLPIHQPQWVLIKEIARIREGLMYAREAKELEVYEENIDEMAVGLQWFVERMVDLLDVCGENAEEKFASPDSGEGEVIM